VPAGSKLAIDNGNQPLRFDPLDELIDATRRQLNALARRRRTPPQPAGQHRRSGPNGARPGLDGGGRIGPPLSETEQQLIDQCLYALLADGDPGRDAFAVLDELEHSL